MANSRIPHSLHPIKFDQTQWHQLEALLCQAGGLAQLIMDHDLINYQQDEPLHQVLWLLGDLIIKARETSQHLLN
jgi:hypothetical protein